MMNTSIANGRATSNASGVVLELVLEGVLVLELVFVVEVVLVLELVLVLEVVLEARGCRLRLRRVLADAHAADQVVGQRESRRARTYEAQMEEALEELLVLELMYEVVLEEL
jgi:hypothetical protein